MAAARLKVSSYLDISAMERGIQPDITDWLLQSTAAATIVSLAAEATAVGRSGCIRLSRASC
jgi:hypothetical protein